MSSERLETVEAYVLGTIGAIKGAYEVLIKEPLSRYLGELAVRRNHE